MSLRAKVDIDQIQTGFLTGAGTRLATSTSEVKATGNLASWDGNNVVDSGIALSSLSAGLGGMTPIFDSDGSPIFDSDGNWIFPG